MTTMNEKKKGLVMSVSPDGEITVMTPQGEFVNIAWSGQELPELGSELEFSHPVVRKNAFANARRFFAALAASIILLLLGAPLLSHFSVPGPQKVIAYVSVDINPSIVLGINYQGVVKEAVGLNDEGVKLLQKLDLAERPADQAVQMITAEAVKEKYIAPDKENAVLISVSAKKELPEPAKNLEQQVKKVLEQEKIAAAAEVIEVPMEIQKKAREEKISPGKYVILIEAVEEGLDLSLEDVKGSGIVKAVKEAGGTPGQLISKAKQDRNKMKEILKNYEKKIKEQAKNQKNNKKGKTETPEKNIAPPGKNGSRDKDGKSEDRKKTENENDDRDKDDTDRDGNDKDSRDKDSTDNRNRDKDSRDNRNRDNDNRDDRNRDRQNNDDNDDKNKDDRDRQNNDDDDKNKDDKDRQSGDSGNKGEDNKLRSTWWNRIRKMIKTD